ncbi:MAG: hypothetical protein ACUVV6_04285 [Thermoplasmatota archaeon]
MRRSPRAVIVAAASAALLLFALPGAPAGASGSGSYPYPGAGDWRIDRDTVVMGETIEVRGNITVESGAQLRLIDCKIIVNCSRPGQYRVLVRAGGSIDVAGGSISPADPASPFRLVVESGPAPPPLSPEALLIVGVLLGIGVGFPGGIAATAYAYKRFFSRNLPPPV